MLVSSKFGGLPRLSWLWDHGPIWAALVVLIADFGIMMLLMLAEGLPPWQRQQYFTVVTNDLVVYPLYAAMVVFVLDKAPPLHGFYTTAQWHRGLLATGLITSVGLEVLGVRIGQYTLSQELSPSKLWHTFIFGIMFYWLLSAFIPTIMSGGPRWAIGLVLLCLLITVVNMGIEIASPMPPNAHLEGTYIPWRWYIRH